jgi:bifunctional non-homologous end joining protein LigD
MHFWAFDLLALNGRDLRPQPLMKRKGSLQALLERFDCPAILPSEAFADGQALLRAAEKHCLEGVVSKRRSAPYRSGDCRDGRKIKTVAWRGANRERWRMFERG